MRIVTKITKRTKNLLSHLYSLLFLPASSLSFPTNPFFPILATLLSSLHIPFFFFTALPGRFQTCSFPATPQSSLHPPRLALLAPRTLSRCIPAFPAPPRSPLAVQQRPIAGWGPSNGAVRTTPFHPILPTFAHHFYRYPLGALLMKGSFDSSTEP